MCYSSTIMPSREVKAKEHLMMQKRQHHMVPVPVKPTKADGNKMVCIRQPIDVVVRKFDVRSDIEANWRNGKLLLLLALVGRRNVKATINQMQQIVVRHRTGKALTVYWGWLKEGTKIDIGYPVRKRVRKAKAITGAPGMAMVKAALRQQDRLPKVRASRRQTVAKV